MEKKLYDLTAPQRSILLTEQYFKGTNINHICGSAFIYESIDFDALKKALNYLVKYNDSLRISLCLENNIMKQYVRDYTPFDIEIIDVPKKENVTNIEQDLMNQVFDIYSNMFFCKMFRLPDGSGGFSVNIHHLVSDSWTLGLVAKEVVRIYSSLVKGEEIDFSNISSYLDYIKSEQEYTVSDKFKKDKEYWNSVFEEIPESASIPSSKQDTDSFSCKANRLIYTISKKEMDEINRYCKEAHISAFNFFMALVAIYTSRVSGLENFVIGTPILNRTNFKEKNTMGMFINVVPLSMNLQENQTFLDFASGVAKRSFEMMRHQKYSYQYILEDLRAKDASLPNLYHILMSYQITKASVESGVPYDTRWAFNGNVNDDLEIHLYDLNDTGSIDIAYDYRMDKYDEAEISAIHDRMLHMIHQVLNEKSITIHNIEIVTSKEKYDILYKFNNTDALYPKDKTIIDLFEEQVEKTPDHIAVVFEDQKLTYQELNEKANQLAHYLIHMGVKPNDVVALRMPKCLEMIIGILGIMKAGATYLPINLSYPQDRVDFMLQDSNASFFLYCPCKESVKISIPMFDISLSNTSIYSSVTENLTPLNTPDDVIYIIYTSGSTGTPKGAMLMHKNVVRLLKNDHFQFDFNDQDVWTMFHSVAFDFSVWEMYGALLFGGKLVLVPEDVAQDPNRFLTLLRKEKVTVLNQTPTYFYNLLNAELKWKDSDLFVRYIIYGGEALKPSAIKPWKDKYPFVKLINMYGITETTVHVTFKELFAEDLISQTSNIGTPIPTLKVFILDKHLRLLPFGVAGEICVTGAGVFKGYLNRPELNCTKLIPNPYHPDEIMYRSGDSAILHTNGTLEYCGRIDSQIKIRGFRVELGEIEEKLLRIPHIASCVVAKKTDEFNHDILCAYYVKNGEVDIASVKSILKKDLAQYMIPQYFIELEHLPYNHNGKINRNALPLPSITSLNKEILPPRNEIDVTIIDILKDILHVNTISIDDSFLELGGDSLSAINFCTILANKLGVQVLVKDVLSRPVISDLSDYISSVNLSANTVNMVKAPKMDTYPLSTAQQRIYYAIKAIGEDTTTYNISGGLLSHTLLDHNKILNAFQKLMMLHSAFRTCFRIIDDKPCQVVLENVPFSITIHKDKKENKESIIHHFPKAFDLEKAPLLRVCVYDLDEKETLILIDSHHIVLDGTSLNILIRDFCTLYCGKEVEKNIFEYIDYTMWEEDYCNSDTFKEKEAYWVNLLKDSEIPIINLPYDYKMPAVPSYEGNRISKKISPEFFLRFERMAKEIGCSPYMLFLAVFYVLLYKYTSQDHIVLGTPFANRSSVDLQNMIGMFVNNMVLNGHIDSNKTFRAFLEEIKNLVLDALNYQPYPYDLLVKKLNANGRNLFDVMFIYQNMKKDSYSLENSPLEIIEANTKTSKFNLSLEIVPDTNVITLEYRTDLLKEETVVRILNHYLYLLEHIETNMDTKIADISMLSQEERNLILYDFNNTFVDYPKNKTIIELFEEQVNKTPDHIAVVFEDQTLTYRELNEKANALAWYLRKNHIERNDIVSIMMNRSLELLVSIIGVLKSGASYIPIDPNFPKDRTEYMLENSQSKLLLADSSIASKIDFKNKLIIDLSNNMFTVNMDNPPSINTFDDTSYIIYTSGSTGKPKGVVLKHGSLTNLTHYLNHYIEFFKENSNISIASVTTASFDIFLFETLIALQKGFKVILANEDEQRLPNKLNLLIQKNNIKAIQMTPSRMRMFVDAFDDCPNLANLDYVILAGEPLPDSLLKDLLSLGVKKVYNGYGPSETTVFSTFTDVTDYQCVTIGKPLDNTQMYILDKDFSPVPIGVAGELFISGDGVGKGYLNNDSLTKERFIQNPFEPTSLMYRTGDVCKFLENGEISYLERLDNQVKIRGLRIELGEIEAKLLEFPFIKKVKVVKQNIQNRDFISAYYVSTTDLKVTELRKFLLESLPEYMIPSYFTSLEDFPYTPNGKIDKNALPLPNVVLEENSLAYLAPKTDTEIALINILENILKVKPIGMNDNFFLLGGDSLTAILLCTHIKKIFQVDLSFKDIIRNPVVSDLSNCILTAKHVNMPLSIKSYEKREFYPVSSAQQRTYLASTVDKNSTLYNISGGVVFHTMPNIDKLQKALDCIVARHTVLRTFFTLINGEIVQKVSNTLKAKIYIEEVDTNDLNKLFKKYQTIFDLAVAPLWKIYLLKLPNGDALLLFNVHHIIFDGTSLNNLIQELSLAYNEENLPKLSISYTDFAIWENEQLLNNNFKDSKAFWLEQFKDDIPILNMPTTYSRPATKSYEGNTFVTYVSKELTDKINDFTMKNSVTPYMLMLCAYYILLYKYTLTEDIVIGSPISGRPYEELQPLLGMFVNSLPLRNTVSSHLTFEEFLLQIKNSCMEAFSHQDYPFDVLVNDLNIARDASRSPLFDTMFTYQNNGFTSLDFDGISAYNQVPPHYTSKFDLSLEVLPIDEQLKLSFEYCTKLFDENFIKRLSKHYLNILSTILKEPNIKIADIDILCDDERNKILYNFNNTNMDYPKDKTIIDLFEEQVKKTPNHVALVFEDKQLTYDELNKKANALAWHLKELGIGPRNVVGIMLPRSLEVLVAMLGVLKLGACYIPIDPTLPANRIHYMLTNSKADLLLTMNGNTLSDIKIDTIPIGFDNYSIYSGKVDNLNVIIPMESPSYMIYTSGSTGTPKGVVLNYKALTNLTTYLNNTVAFLQDEYANIAMASITTISFDIFIFETLICLQRGLKIVMANEAEQNTPNLLDELIVRNHVQAIQMTPSRMYIWLNNKNLMPHLQELKYITLAGEALPKDLLNRILELGNIIVYNGYGPSETTVFSSFTDVTGYEEITIGKPLANTRFYILDKDMNPVPIGNPGEIYIAGAGVGIGYSNNDELTKERFVQDIFYPNERMYQTGDLATYLPNGEIHYIGRVDNQIKIRGLRIELDEIENCILQYPNIDKCIISSDVDSNNRQFIVAYLTVTDRISINKLRMFLKTLLPKYMVPSYFIILDKIPYLNNGKINKKALPKVDLTSSNAMATTYVAPRNKLELQITSIFQSLLSISPIGINDNFFELGGDSLLAINLQVELLKLSLNITYSDIFMYPTVKELAKKASSSEVSIFNTVDTSGFSDFHTILESACLLPNKLEFKSIGNVLITGTTGFLGAHVLDAYLKNETGIAYCLVRPEAGLTLENKFMKKLHFYFGDKYDNLVGKRIIIVNSDIAKNNLALSNDELVELANNISCVINCAAKVSHFGNYNNYKEINVVGTENLLKFCLQYHKRFYQISTLSVSGNSLVEQSYIEQSFEKDVIFKENNFYIHQSLDNVYVRSKFEAEKLVFQYILKGLDAYICRVGNLMNRFTDGKFQPNVDENAYISRLLSLASIGCIPDYLLNGYMEFTPIDCCAEAIIKLAQYPSAINRVFHLYDNNHVDVNYFITILKNYIPFEVVSHEEFVGKINTIFKQDNSSKILSGILRDFDSDEKLVYESPIKLNCDFTKQYLAKTKFNWPNIGKDYLIRFLDYFCSIGYLIRKEN